MSDETKIRIQRELREAMEAGRRESTAATILAALVDDRTTSALTRWDGDRLVVERLGTGDHRMVSYAVALADALRAELEKKS